MSETCPFCGETKHPQLHGQIFNDPKHPKLKSGYFCGCMIWEDGKIDRQPECYELEIARLKKLVRELVRDLTETLYGADHMETAITRMSDRLDCPEYLSYSRIIYRANKSKEILSRPDIREIMEEI